MKYFGKAYIASLLFFVTAVVLFLSGYYLYSALVCVPAFLLNSIEIGAFTTIYQFINFHLCSLLLGLSVDMIYGGNSYYYTLCMACLPLVCLARLELFRYMALAKHLWVEALGFLSVYSVYVYAGLQHPTDWKGWVLPLLVILPVSNIGIGVLKGAIQTNKANQQKYNAELGHKAPPFCLPDPDGKEVSLSDFSGKHHVLLVFVRGDWCPTCHIMIRMYESNRDKFMKKNIVAIGIAPDSTEVNKEMMSRLGWKNMLLSDNKQKVANDYGIKLLGNNPLTNFEEGVPLPASFLVDKDGIVRYISRSDKVGEFLNPSLIFPILEKLN